MLSASAIIFAITKLVSNQRCVASIVSSHRNIDITLVESSWTARTCNGSPVEFICGTLPLETVSYGDSDSPERMSDEDLIRWAGQNQTELYLPFPFTNLDLPLFLTTGNPEVTHRYRVQFRLVVRTWGAFPDFCAEQRYWIRHYQAQIAAGNNYLEERLSDLHRQQELACRIGLAAGDTIPVTIHAHNNTHKAGCLLIRETFPDGMCGGDLFVLGEQGESQSEIHRLVRWEEGGVENKIDAIIAEITDWTYQ